MSEVVRKSEVAQAHSAEVFSSGEVCSLDALGEADEAKSWTVAPLGRHAAVKARIGWRGLASSEYTEDGPFLVAGKHVRDGLINWADCDHITEHRYRESMEIALEAGDVILTKDGTIGRVARIDLLPDVATINGTMMLVRAGQGLDYRYLFHTLRGAKFKKLIDDKVSGSSIPHIFQRDMVTLPIALPPVEQQRGIADALDTLDTTIRQTEAIIAKLKQVKQGLLHDLLTRGIDANGELRPPQSQAPHLYKRSPLGWIPKEWSASSMGDSCTNVVDCPHSTPVFREDGVLVARTMHIKGGTFLEHIASYVSEAAYQERITRLCPEPGDVVFTREAPVGEAFVIPVGMRICLGQRVMLLRPRPDKLRGEFLVAQVYSGAVADRIAALTAGTTNPHLNVAEVRGFLVPLPSMEEQLAIGQHLSRLEDDIHAESVKRDKLSATKSGLMDDLLTGRVRVTPLLETATA